MVDVPGYGRFDPDLPSWLRLVDGKLYNVNASANKAADGSFQAVRPWTPPEGWVGGGGITFTPEAALPPPVQPPPPPEPPVQPPPPPAPVDPYALYIEYQREALVATQAEVDAQFDNAARAHDSESATLDRLRIALDKFEAALAARR